MLKLEQPFFNKIIQPIFYTIVAAGLAIWQVRKTLDLKKWIASLYKHWGNQNKINIISIIAIKLKSEQLKKHC